MSDSPSIFSIGLVVSALIIFWSLSSTSSSPFARTFPQLENKRICLLIAHPDDEAMFFAPTVLSLTRPELGNHLKILCLSSGDADGLGHIRAKELQTSAKKLGLRSESDVLIIEDPSRFADGMKNTWAENDISSILTSAFAPELAAAAASSNKKQQQQQQQKKGNKPPVATIDVLLTFDRHGVSNHPNHRSLYHGAVHFLRTLMKDKAGFSCPITLYTLSTTTLLRKYLGIFDAPITMFRGALHTLFSGGGGGKNKSNKKDDLPRQLLFVNSVPEYLTAQSAMVNAHRSQMVWFRWGWISIGRYMIVNDLRKERI